MIRTVETLAKEMEKGGWKEMSLAAKLRSNSTLSAEEVDECIAFLKGNDGHESLIKAFERCLEEGVECKRREKNDVGG